MTMTLKEIYQALLNGETLINDLTQEKVHLSDGWLVNEKGEHTTESFLYIDNWEVYKDPNGPKNWIGKLCWFWDDSEEEKKLGLLTRYLKHSFYPFLRDVMCYKNCRLLTREEVEQYLAKEN